MAMIFAVVSTLKERVESLIQERQAAEQAQLEQEAVRREEEENRRFIGAKVTRESFLEWRERFRREMREAEERRRAEEERGETDGRAGGGGGGSGGGGGGAKSGGKKEERKLTGRELWERGLAGKIDEDNAPDEINAVGEEMDKLKVG